jgi:hypothetical protein
MFFDFAMFSLCRDVKRAGEKWFLLFTKTNVTGMIDP